MSTVQDVRVGSFAADTLNVMTRELKPLWHEPLSALFAMVQPLVFLGLFAPLLPAMADGSALQWFVPGIISMTCLMGASFTGSNLLRGGSRSPPTSTRSPTS